MEEMKYIGLPKRFVAFILDYVMITILSAIVFGVMIYFSFKNESIVTLVTLLVALLYYTLMESSSRQATLGKALMKIKVVNASGEQLTFMNALVRFLGKFLSLLLAGLGFLMIPFTKKRQGLHDIFAKTYVVKIEDYEAYIEQQSQKVSTKAFALLGYILMGLLGIIILNSILSSQIAKDAGNFLALALGGVIWIGIFYGLYRAKNSAAGQLILKIVFNLLSPVRGAHYLVLRKGEVLTSTHKTLEDAIDFSARTDDECYITYSDTKVPYILGTYQNGKKVSERKTW